MKRNKSGLIVVLGIALGLTACSTDAIETAVVYKPDAEVNVTGISLPDEPAISESKPTVTLRPSSEVDTMLIEEGGSDGAKDTPMKESITDFSVDVTGDYCVFSWNLTDEDNKEVYVEYISIIDEYGNVTVEEFDEKERTINKISWLCEQFDLSATYTYFFALNTKEVRTGTIDFGNKIVTHDTTPRVITEDILKHTTDSEKNEVGKLDYDSQTVSQDKIPETIGKQSNHSEASVVSEFAGTPVAKNSNEIAITYSKDGIEVPEEDLSEISNIVKNTKYPLSFVLYDINTGNGIAYNEKRYYPSASTVKAPFVYTCLQQISEGDFSLQDIITLQEKHMTEADPSGLTRSSLGKSFTVENLIDRTIRVSDNIGYITLLDYFGVEEYRDLLKSLGNKVTIGGGVKWGSTSALDSLRLWLKIYEYLVAGEEYAEWFGSLLVDTNKSFARDVLGDKYTIYNKMGWVYDQCCHEQALVMADNPYIVIVMTEGNVREKNEREMKALISVLDVVHKKLVNSN